MSSWAVSLSAIFLGLSLLCAVLSHREKRSSRRRICAVLGLVSFIVSAGMVFWALLSGTIAPAAMLWLSGALVLVGLALWAALILLNQGHGNDLRLIRKHLRFAKRVALPDWESLDTSELRAEDRTEATHINEVVNIGAVLVIFPGVVGVLGASILMNVRGNETSDFLSHAVGFYTLLVATCWTVAYILTIVIVSLLQLRRGTASGITLSQVAVSLGTWAGFGAAGGVFVGTLIPLVVVPLSTGQFSPLGMALLDSVSPALLLDISTAGAVYGFLIGEVISVVSIAAGEKNLYVKTVLPPTLFASIVTVLGLVGLTPGKLAHALSNEYIAQVLGGLVPSGTDPFATALTEGLDTQRGWAHVVAGLDQGGWNTIVDHHIFYIFTWVVAFLVVMFSLTIAVRKREMALLATPPESTAQLDDIN